MRTQLRRCSCNPPGLPRATVPRRPLKSPNNPTQLAGEVEVLIRGFNHTGHSVEEAFFGVSREEVMRNYNLVVDERTMLFDWARYRTRLDYLVSQETIFLPLSADGQNVNMVLTYTVVQGL